MSGTAATTTAATTSKAGATTVNATTTTTPTMSDQERVLRAAMAANVPVLLMGAPGTAKTATLEAIAAEQGAYIEIVIASAQDPTTILGIPMPTEDRKYTEPTTPGWARRINEHAANGEPTILFVDEVGSIPESVSAPMLGVIQSRRADGWTLPADTRIVAAGNPPDLAAGGWALAPAMANRWVHVAWDVPHAAWVAWARAQGSPAMAMIADYVDAVPAALLQVPSNISMRSGAWPSPRSWTNAARLIDAAGSEWTLAAHAVGTSASDAFAAWARTRDVPSVADMLSGARALPTRPDAFAASLGALVAAATPDTLGRTIEILTESVNIDPSVVRDHAKDLARRGVQDSRYLAGLAPLVAALRDAGADLI